MGGALTQVFPLLHVIIIRLLVPSKLLLSLAIDLQYSLPPFGVHLHQELLSRLGFQALS